MIKMFGDGGASRIKVESESLLSMARCEIRSKFALDYGSVI